MSLFPLVNRDPTPDRDSLETETLHRSVRILPECILVILEENQMTNLKSLEEVKKLFNDFVNNSIHLSELQILA